MKNKKGQFVKGMIPWNKGKHPAYVQGSNHPRFGKHHSPETIERLRQASSGANHWAWKGGVPQFQKSRGRYAYEGKVRYRIVAEEILGRPLKTRETIHHINEIKTDDRPENLFLFRHPAAHARWHEYIKRHKLPGNLLQSNLSIYSLK